MKSKGYETWAFVTPFNPFSEFLSEAENKTRLSKLEQQVFQPFLLGQGRGEDDKWPPETSLLIFKITQHEAESIGREYGQNAIVCGEIGGEAKLILLQTR